MFCCSPDLNSVWFLTTSAPTHEIVEPGFAHQLLLQCLQVSE